MILLLLMGFVFLVWIERQTVDGMVCEVKAQLQQGRGANTILPPLTPATPLLALQQRIPPLHTIPIPLHRLLPHPLRPRALLVRLSRIKRDRQADPRAPRRGRDSQRGERGGRSPCFDVLVAVGLGRGGGGRCCLGGRRDGGVDCHCRVCLVWESCRHLSVLVALLELLDIYPISNEGE